RPRCTSLSLRDGGCPRCPDRSSTPHPRRVSLSISAILGIIRDDVDQARAQSSEALSLSQELEDPHLIAARPGDSAGETDGIPARLSLFLGAPECVTLGGLN